MPFQQTKLIFDSRCSMEISTNALNRFYNSQSRWLITGVAGFIGSNLLEFLLQNNQIVVGLDNFSTGFQRNLDEVKNIVGPDKWRNFKFIEGDIRNLDCCRVACSDIDYILHQAALGSVPRSIDNPLLTNEVNISGFLNMLIAAKDSKVKKFVYAASSSTYGDHPGLPKVENIIGKPLSPYAVTKYVNELYADVFYKTYGLDNIGLRYFNVFGPRQNPDGAYSAVIPRWIKSIINNNDIFINGDGETSRDFNFIHNIILANILAATNYVHSNEIYNVAAGKRTSLSDLLNALISSLKLYGIDYNGKIHYKDFRSGDVRHSLADISKIKSHLDYVVLKDVEDGIKMALPWYINAYHPKSL